MRASRKKESDARSNGYQIGGIAVDFPHKAYGSQLAFMGRVISTLDRAQKQGHCHALLESPTGTGKTLSLLCSTLAWQKSFSSRYSAAVGNDTPTHAATGGSDPFVDGGGFVLESEPSQKPSPKVGTNEEKKERAPPKIYYASRTHTQISQAINEYRKTAYRVPMAVLASRKHYCTNQVICKSEDVNENCKKLLKNEEMGCMEFKNVNRVKEHPSIKRDGRYQVHDIEDLVKIGQSVKGCSYFGARSLAGEAHLVFCPYNYVINPIIRKAMEIDLKGHILILDEAHNIEDMARDAASIDMDEDTLHRLQNELGELCFSPTGNSETYQPLHDMVQGIISWIGRRTDDLGYHDFEHYSSSWTGDSAVRELADSGICLQSFQILEGCAKKAIKDYSEGGSEQPSLSGMSATMLEGFFGSLCHLFTGGSRYSTDYQLVLQRYGKREGNNAKSWVHTLSLWCLNPGVVFKEMADLSLSIILTSGTLSPMDSFSSELEVQFEVCMEAPHVINVESQLFATVLSRGPRNQRLNASYKMSDGYAFQDELGSSLEEIFKAVPGGVLVFFPSYKFLEKLQSRWHQTGKWSQLNAQKLLFTEPRSAGDFDVTLKAYFDSARGLKTTVHGKIKERQKRTLKRFPGMHLKDSSNRRGAALLAVFRGKVSEGVNFTDDDARAVVIVGIPFPSINDLQVCLKKKYNDAFRSSKSLLGGSEWYCHQAFRALNQAAGRCIRHRSDYGAVIFLDERFEEDRNRAYISKWIGHSIKQFGSFDLMLDELRPFFLNAKESRTVETPRTKSQFFPKFGNIVLDARQKKIVEEGAKREKRIPVTGSEGCADQTRYPVLDEASFASDSASNFDEIPMDERLKDDVHDPDVEEASLSVNTRCHKRKMMTDLQLHESTRSISLDDYDDVAVKRGLKTLTKSCLFDSAVEEPARVADDMEVKLLTRSSNLKVKKLHPCCLDDDDDDDDNDDVSVRCSLENSEDKCCEFKHQETLSKSRSLDSAVEEPAHLLDDVEVKPLTWSSNAKGEKLSPSCLDDDDDVAVRCSLEKNLEEECRKLNHQETLTKSCSFDSAVEEPTRLPEADDAQVKKLTGSTALKTEKLHLCCFTCRTPIGLRENRFLIPCSIAASSKPCLSLFLENKFARNKHVAVGIVDVWNVDQHILGGPNSGESRQPDVWSEEDGCVFRPISCPFCPATSSTILGLQIMATDALNANLLNKVIFFHERLHIKPDLTSENKDPMEVGRCAFAEQSPASQSRNRSKLRLPRRGRD